MNYSKLLTKPTYFFSMLLFCLIFSCTPKKIVLHSPQDPLPKDRSLKKIISNCTRHLQKHKEWATVLDVDAIYIEWELRKKMLDRLIADRNIPEEKAAALLEREEAMHKGYIEFYLSVFTTKREWNNLDKDEPCWNIFLVDSSLNEYASFKVEKLDLNPALLFAYSPSISDWRTMYRVSFLRKPQEDKPLLLEKTSESFGLVFKGYMGEARLTWNVAG